MNLQLEGEEWRGEWEWTDSGCSMYSFGY